MIAVGWFGVPGLAHTSTKTHLVSRNRPMCGARLRADQEFQFCAYGLKLDYIECDRCRKKAVRWLESEIKVMKGAK